MNRIDFQDLANVRIEEAKVLLDAGKWDGAYYLAGYAVECGLKACVARLTKVDDFPDKDFAARCYTHSIERLVDLAGLKTLRDADMAADAALSRNWAVVREWDETSRYARYTRAEAESLYAAVADAGHGVLQWIRRHW